MTKDLPLGWAFITLGEVLAPRKGKHTPDPSDPRPYLSLDNIESHTSRITAWERSSDYSSQSSQLFAGDVVYARLRPYLNKIAVLDREALGSAELIVLPRIPEVLPSFLCYRLLSNDFVRFADQHSTGDRPRLKWAQMRNFPFELPPIAEQERIVDAIEEHFTRLDAASDTVTVAQARVEASRLSVLTEAFAGKLVPQDRNDETASALLDRIAADQRTEPAAREAHHGPSRLTRDLPPGWAWARLEDLAAAEPRAITDGPFGSNLKTAHYTDGGPRVIRLQNIGDGVFRPEDAHISDEHYSLLAQHSVQADDLVVASLGETLPRACLVPSWVPPAIVKADCIRVRLHPEVNPSYVNFALRHPGLRQQTSTEIKGVGRPRLGLRGIRNLPVPLAPLAEQHRVVAVIEEHFSRLDATSQVLVAAKAKIEDLRRCVLSEAFRGRLVPQDPTDEAASILLERIAASRDLRRRGRRSSHDNTPGGHRS